MRQSKGFTLIELLVVIAIVGILSSIVISALNNARDKGADTATKANLATLRTEMALYYDTNNTYGSNGVCTLAGTGAGVNSGAFNDPKVKEVIAAVRANLAAPAQVSCASDFAGKNWAVMANKLRRTGATWCVDHRGWSGPAIIIGTATYLANGSCDSQP